YRRRPRVMDPCYYLDGIFAPPTPQYETCRNPLARQLCVDICLGCTFLPPNFDPQYDPSMDRGGVLRCCCKKGEPDTSPPGLNAVIRCLDQVDIDLSPRIRRLRPTDR